MGWSNEKVRFESNSSRLDCKFNKYEQSSSSWTSVEDIDRNCKDFGRSASGVESISHKKELGYFTSKYVLI